MARDASIVHVLPMRWVGLVVFPRRDVLRSQRVLELGMHEGVA